MNYYAVIDTNVLVSALLKSASIPGIVARESLEGSAKRRRSFRFRSYFLFVRFVNIFLSVTVL